MKNIFKIQYFFATVVLLFSLSQKANALINPLDDVHDSTPVDAFAAPAGYGNLTGGDGSVDQSLWYAVTDLGYIHIFNGMSGTPTCSIDTGISDLTGVAYKGNNQFAVCAGTNVYEGSISGDTWVPEAMFSWTGSDITDVDWSENYGYIFATENDGIIKVNPDNSTTKIDSLGCDAFDIIELDLDVYENDMLQTQGGAFVNIDQSAIPFGISKHANLNNWTTIQGIAYFDGGMAVIQNPLVELHDEMAYQQYMVSVPEPVTITFLGLGLLVISRKR